jgi:lysine 2,3-aminomutase
MTDVSVEQDRPFGGDAEVGVAPEAVPALKPRVDPATLEYRALRDDEFWRQIPAFSGVERATFLDWAWQSKSSVTKPKQLFALLENLVSDAFVQDVEAGFRRAPMSIRVSPYILSLIDWSAPYEDPLRIQFIPVASRQLPDHPLLGLDSLAEQADAPVPGLTHRYPDKALFLALDTCPVYCRFCTRSYAVGLDTEQVEKVGLRVSRERWQTAFRYIESRPELEDIVLSGGDVWQLRPDQLKELLETLFGFPNVRRIRLATKGLAVLPMKMLTHAEYANVVVDVHHAARRQGKVLVVHTHFNHPNEITAISRDAVDVLFQAGITVRNQTVMQRHVNDDVTTMQTLVKRLGHINVEPYYVYVHDLVRGVEELRTTVQTGVDLEKYLRGTTAGFNTPNVVVDAPGGGGKRVVHSYEHYDRENGIAVYAAPAVRPGALFTYFDPIDLLSPEAQARWADPVARDAMVQAALEAARS